MNKQRKIGWQKYEDVIEDQVANPFIEHIVSKIMPQVEKDGNSLNEDISDISEDIKYIENMINDGVINLETRVPISQELAEEISLAINFDCWIGYTNFDITPSLRRKIEKTEGVEALKIVSRYRFFIGVGKMFNFSDVRQSIEKQIEEVK
jgi:hypothetical protein